jgi:hypothetical protein
MSTKKQVKESYNTVKNSLSKALKALGSGAGMPVKKRMAVLRDRRLLLKALKQTETHAKLVTS